MISEKVGINHKKMFHQKCSIKNKVVRGIAILLSSEYLTHLNTILKRKKDGQILGKEPKKKEEVKSREKFSI